MADMRIGSTLFFERGLEGIVEAPETARLPAGQDVAPPDHAHRAALDELLMNVDNLETLLTASVRPDLVDRDLLSPARFRAALDVLAERIAHAAQKQRAINPRESRLLDMAVALLTDEIELRELLQMYRQSLLQG